MQEEIGLFGARTAAFELRPTWRSRSSHPRDRRARVDEKEIGKPPLGSGPVIGRGLHPLPKVFELLVETAEAEGIEYSISASGRGTSTDPDVSRISRAGIPTGLVSIPHALHALAVEMVDLTDVEAHGRAAGRVLRPGSGRRRLEPLTATRLLKLFRQAAEVAQAVRGDDDQVLAPHPPRACRQVDARARP